MYISYKMLALYEVIMTIYGQVKYCLRLYLNKPPFNTVTGLIQYYYPMVINISDVRVNKADAIVTVLSSQVRNCFLT